VGGPPVRGRAGRVVRRDAKDLNPGFSTGCALPPAISVMCTGPDCGISALLQRDTARTTQQALCQMGYRLGNQAVPGTLAHRRN